jgi:hypothetical protein
MSCDLCGSEREDLDHFLLWCPAYITERSKQPLLQQPYVEDRKDTIGSFLFLEENVETAKETIQIFWRLRGKLIKSRKE